MGKVTYTFTANTKIKSEEVNTNFSDLANVIRPTFVFTVVGSLTTGTSQTPILIAQMNLTIVKAYAAVKTAPVGADLIIDINKNGTSIWNVTPSNRLKITDGNTTGSQTSFDTTSISEGDLLTLDIDQVGSTTAGSDLTVELKTEW